MMSTSSFPRLASSLLACALLVVSCSMMKGSSSQGGRDMPSWYLENRPMDPHHIFAAATATAPKLQLASSKAANKARGDIAATVETKFEGLTKQFQEEVGQGPNARSVSQFTQAYKSVVSQTIRGSEVVEREIKREGKGYRAYVLMRMPIGKAQERLLQKIQTQNNAFTRFRASQAFEELEQEVGGYHQRQKDRDQSRESAKKELDEALDEDPQQEQAENQSQTDQQNQPDQQNQTPQQEDQTTDDTPDAEVTTREAEAGDTREEGDAPTKDQIQAEEESNQQTGQQTGGGGQMTKAQRIKQRVREAAEPWMGTPYKFGGETKNGVDCSALVRAVYDDAFNVDLPRTTGKQVNRGSKVRQSNMRPGDLVFFRNEDNGRHVGIYLDNRKFVHASSSQGVTVSPLKYDYWQNNYWQTRRLSVL